MTLSTRTLSSMAVITCGEAEVLEEQEEQQHNSDEEGNGKQVPGEDSQPVDPTLETSNELHVEQP